MHAFVLVIAMIFQVQRPHDPTTLNNLIKWLPPDTETLTVASSWKINENVHLSDDLIASALLYYFLMDLDRSVGYESLEGRLISLAVRGERKFESHRNVGESCTILFFEEELDGSWNLLESQLESHALRFHQIARHKVFHLDTKFTNDPNFKPREGEGLFVTKIDSRVLIVADSQRFLSEVLTRRESNVTERALPESLPEWKFVDPSAPIWMIKHLAQPPDRALFDGIVITWKPVELRATYVGPKSTAENAIRDEWNRVKQVVELEPEPRALVRAERGAIAVSVDLQAIDSAKKLLTVDWYSMIVDLIRAEDGTLISRNEQ